MNMYINRRSAVQTARTPTITGTLATVGMSQKSNMPEAKWPLFMASEEGY